MLRPMLLALAVAAPAVAAGPDGEAKLARLIAGRTAGPPRSCIPRFRDDRSQVIEKVGVVFDVGATRYVSRFDGGCDQLTTFTRLVTRTPTTQLCAGDIADVVTNTPPTINLASCTYGRFVPYTR